MKIGIDTRPMYHNPAGIGLYVKNLFENLKPLEEIELIEFGPGYKKIFWHLSTYLSLLLNKRVDYYLSTHSYLIPCLPFVKSVLVVHDLSVLLFPKDYPRKLVFMTNIFLKMACIRSSHIIVPSKSTKEDLIKVVGVNPQKISVVYHGVSSPGRTSTLPKQLKGSSFFLFVGTIQPRKNLALLIRSFYKVNKKNPHDNLKLVICGEKGWKYDEVFKLVDDLKLKKDVFFLGYIGDSEKFSLYKKAICLVMPSFYEGFGLPLLEAFSNGCPVICSSTKALKEIGGKAALYFDPENEGELISQMEKILDWQKNENRNYIRMVKAGEKRTKMFFWKKTATDTLEVFKLLGK